MERIDAGEELASLMAVLSRMPDPRKRRGRQYPLQAILALAVYAMLCGARSLYAIAQWGRDQAQEVAPALGFSRGKTPCVGTLHYVFRRLDRGAWEGLLASWFQGQGVETGEALAVDGKRLRGVHGEEVPGVHLVAAFAHKRGIVVGQQAVGEKANELDAVPGLLAQLVLAGRVVTADAQFAQKETSREVVVKGGTISGW